MRANRLHSIVIAALLLLALPLAGSAQSNKIEEQRKRVEQYKKEVESAKKEVESLKKQKSSASERIAALDRQVSSRSKYIREVERELNLVKDDIAETKALVDSLGRELEHNRKVYGEAVRTAYRNYRQSNSNNYLFSATSLKDAARRMARIQHIADSRRTLADTIEQQSDLYGRQHAELSKRHRELDSVTRVLQAERKELQSDRDEAQRSYNQLSKKEKKAITRQREQQKRLDNAVAELSKLTKGNKVGGDFSSKTSNLNLPVVGGSIAKSSGGTATITGTKGAEVRSIYEGLVMRVDRNESTNHYAVFIAYGEYLSVYTNISSVTVKAGDKVKRDQKIGTVGLGVDHTGKQYGYVQFAIHDTRAGRQISVTEFFKKK
jgi:septal ring factor EnvC (AmiA/AmiB activator)